MTSKIDENDIGFLSLANNSNETIAHLMVKNGYEFEEDNLEVLKLDDEGE